MEPLEETAPQSPHLHGGGGEDVFVHGSVLQGDTSLKAGGGTGAPALCHAAASPS